jgi:hypothetical protein
MVIPLWVGFVLVGGFCFVAGVISGLYIAYWLGVKAKSVSKDMG